MTFRRLCQSTALLLLLRPATAPAIEALTTSVEEVNARKHIEEQEDKKKLLNEKLAQSRAKLGRLDYDLGVVKAFGDPGTRSPGAPLIAIVPSPGRFTDEEMRSVAQYQAIAAEVFAYQSSLDKIEAQLETRKHDLQAIPVSANVQINSGGSASTVVPGIDASGSFLISKSLDCQMLFSIKPDPPAGTTADVTQSIRMSTGVFSANLGMNYHHFWNEDSKPGADGPQGVEVRAGLPVAYQRASSTDGSASAQSSPSSTDFGLLSPELKISLWLKYVLLGYKYAYYFAFGNSSQVYDAINRTGSHKVYLATKLQALSGDKTPFYIEANYTSGKDSFSGGTFSFGVSKSLSWNPN